MRKDSLNVDTLVEKSIGVQIVKDMEISVRAINGVVNKYSFLFDGDKEKTQEMINKAFFVNGKPLLVEDEIQADMKVIVSHVPDNIKELLLEKIQEEIATKIDVESLGNPK